VSWKAAALVAAVLVAGITVSRLAEGGSGTTTWDASRAAGFAAYLMLWVAVMSGVAVHMRWRPSSNGSLAGVLELHRIASTLALAFVIGHVFGLLIDPVKPFFSLLDAVVPFTSSYRSVQVGLGTLAEWSLIAVLLSTALSGRMAWKTWKAVHYASFPCYLFALIHGLTAGSDSQTPIAIMTYVATTGALSALLAVRMAGRDWAAAGEPGIRPS
jgi:predicted ferric reductase